MPKKKATATSSSDFFKPKKASKPEKRVDSDNEESDASTASNDENVPGSGMEIDDGDDSDIPAASEKKKAAPAKKGTSKSASETYQKVAESGSASV